MALAIELTTVAGSDVDDDGHARVQAKGLGRAPTTSASHVLQPFGLASRPLDPDVDQDGEPSEGCLVLHATEGDQSHAQLMGDSRLSERLPPRPKGSAVVYAAVGEAPEDARKTPPILMFDSSKGGSLILLVPHQGGATSSGVFVGVDVPGAEHVSLRHGLGMGLSIVAGGANPVVLNNKAGDGALVLDDAGCTITAAKVAINGALLLGDPAAAQPLVLGPPMVALLTQLLSIVAAMPGGSAAAALAGQLAATLSQKVQAA